MYLLWPPVLRLAVFFFLYLVSCNGSPSYYISTPTSIIPGVNTSLAVHLFGEKYAEMNVTATILNNNIIIARASKVFSNDSIGILTLPAVPTNVSSSFYVLAVNGSAQNTVIFSASTVINIEMNNIRVLIQTDKYVYKAGEIVKIRVITLNPDMKPYKDGAVDIVIRDSSYNIVQQRLSLEADLGVVSTEFSLSNKPMLGSWTIAANCSGSMRTSQFSVEDYVEPTFDVTLDMPSFYILPKNLSFNGTVTAKYFYGIPLKGNVTVSVKDLYYSEPEINKTYQISGSTNFSFTNQEIQNVSLSRYFVVTATVTAEFTGVAIGQSSTVQIADSEYSLKIVGERQAFVPGQNFSFKVQIQRIDNKNLTKEEKSKVFSANITQYSLSDNSGSFSHMVLTSDVSVVPATESPSSGYTQNFTQKNYTIPENAIIDIEFPVLQSVQYVNVGVSYQNTTEFFYFDAFYWMSPSIRPLISETVLTVGTPFNVQVETSPKVQDIYYMVVANGMIVSAGKNKTTFSLTPDQSWTPTAQLVVYYLKINSSFGDIVQNVSQVFPVKSELGNKVTLSWSKNRANPLESVSLSISVKETRSLVCLQVADSNNLNVTRVGELISYYQSSLTSLTDGVAYVFYGKSYITKRRNSGMIGTNIEEMTPPNTNNPVFTETWIWLDTNMSSSLTTQLQLTAPNKNATWKASAFVISEGLGLGVTDMPVEISIVKSLISVLRMPFSLTRGEQCIIEVDLVNSLKENLQVMVTLESSSSFDILIPNNSAGTIPGQYNVTVQPEAATSVLFPINPKKLGNVTVKVTVTSKSASEVLTKTIVVKAEGVKYFYSQSALLDLTDTAVKTVSKNFSFTFPSDVIADTIEGFVTAVGDVLGPSINSLESLILMPYGCGEQNMINFAPNIYILLYLNATKQLKEDIRKRAIEYMEKGYQNELTYKRFDGSFSAFGESDTSGSTWLTAFVLRCFLQARSFIYIDPAILNQAIQWLLIWQDVNTGIFSEPGRVIHKDLQGGQNGPITLTAYILSSLLEDEYYKSVSQSNINRAVQYLESTFDNGITDNYALSIVVYALTLAKSSKAEAALNQLNSRANVTGNTKFWSSTTEQTYNYWQPRTTDIETAAYALLSFYYQGRISDGYFVMKWLSEKRNYLGGYGSTQDTVMALQALSQYQPAVGVAEGATSITLTVTGSGSFVTKTFQLNSNNYLELQRQQITVPQPLFINATAVGRRLAIFQLNLEYNRKPSSRAKRDTTVPEAFKLDVTVKEDASNIYRLSVEIRTSYLSNNSQSGMVLLEVGLLSGFTLSPIGIPTTDIIKYVELKEDKVFLYLDSVSTPEIFISVPLVRTASVSSSQDAVVTILEYYEPRNSATRTYNSPTMKKISFCDFCGPSCNQCKSNVAVKPQTSSSTKPAFYRLCLCILLISYLL
ncbi:CD109 antigen-like [Anomaloglossus baeobatrachus]|uniref:CD109 antigen-like n=1 Tax=Anomaloglossus baeobatrachus TaxID=238106 RepID=UPI003F50A508